MEVRTTNQFEIAMMNKKVLILKGRSHITTDEALNMAAWLITVSYCLSENDHEVDAKLKYILSVIKDPNVEAVKGEKKQ